MRQKLSAKRVAEILFSLLVASLLGLGGSLAGWYLWRQFGPTARDADDTGGYLFGLLVGGVLAVCGGVACLWRFWPRARSSRVESISAVDRKPLEL
jgi:hypothetical protein